MGVEYVADAASRRDNLTRPIYYRVYDDLSPSSQVHLGATKRLQTALQGYSHRARAPPSLLLAFSHSSS